MSAQPRQVVEAFYDAASRRDGEALVELVTSSFHADAAVEWPAGLPYGGRVEGARTLRKVFAGMATPEPVLGPENLEVLSVVEGGRQIAVQIASDWRANGATVPSGALELWTFDEGLVTEIRAYYWDTAACQALLQTQPA